MSDKDTAPTEAPASAAASQRVFLVVVDESEEMRNALRFAMEVGPLCDGARDSVRQRLVRIIEAALAKDQQS